MIIARPTIKKTIIEFDNAMGTDAELVNIGLEKGDMIVFRGEGDPIRIQATEANKILVTDPTTESGWKLVDAPDSMPTVFENGSGSTIARGTVVEINSSGKIVPASNIANDMLYVTSDSVDDGDTIICYGIPGTITKVKCTTLAVAVGDRLTISTSNGYCTKKTASEREIGVAIEAKESGSTGLVDCILSQDMARTSTSNAFGDMVLLKNVSGSTISKGTVVYADSDTMAIAGDDSNPIFVTSQACPTGKSVRCYGVPGTVCYAMCTTAKVSVGDFLTPKSNFEPLDNLKTPTGMFEESIGSRCTAIALSSKSAGSEGLVKVLLCDTITKHISGSILGTLSDPWTGIIYYEKTGAIVNIFFSGIYLNSALSSDSVNLCTLPSGLAPDTDIFFWVGSPSVASGFAGAMSISAQGTLAFHKPSDISTWPTTGALSSTATYISHA